MKQRLNWVLALLSVLTLMSTTTLAIASEATTSAKLEVGVVAKDTKDNPARVNEYATFDSTDAASATLDAEIDVLKDGILFEAEADYDGLGDQDYSLEIDYQRILKFGFDFSLMEHWKDQEDLGFIGATMTGDVGGNQPRVGTNLTGTLGADYSTLAEANAQYFEEQSNDYITTRKEWKNEAELRLPMLPNVVIHTGMRIERRDGMEQSITLSKCNACHVEANGKTISERTEDFTLGATGKFGAVTLDYEFLTRSFEDDSSAEQYNYLSSGVYRGGSPTTTAVRDVDQMLYIGTNDYAKTPDSEKDSHALKARVDLPQNWILTGSYVKADIESQKMDLDDGLNDGGTPTYAFVSSNELESEYTGYTGKLATRLGPVRLSATANVYEIEGPTYTLTFPDRDDIDADPYTTTQTFHSAESREVQEFGLNAVYRLNMGTTLRLSYEFEDIEREEADLGETETHTFKAAINSRLAKGLSVRGSYEYQDIDDPFHIEDGAGIGQVTGMTDPLYPGLAWYNTADFRPDNPSNNIVYYWNSVYPSRELDTSNQPDEVHELKASANWSPASNLSATVFARVRMEENSEVQYEQDTYVPGVSIWYAPNSKMNLTMAYTFNKQDTENKMCVGWYHG